MYCHCQANDIRWYAYRFGIRTHAVVDARIFNHLNIYFCLLTSSSPLLLRFEMIREKYCVSGMTFWCELMITLFNVKTSDQKEKKKMGNNFVFFFVHTVSVVVWHDDDNTIWLVRYIPTFELCFHFIFGVAWKREIHRNTGACSLAHIQYRKKK